MKEKKIRVFDIKDLEKIDKQILDKYPILRYRLNNIANGVDVRGLKDSDSKKCAIVLDDSVIAGSLHFPCIIYMREGGNPIGKVGKNMRQERFEWFKTHDTHLDNICKTQCLDVCIQMNNKIRDTNPNLKKFY